MGAYKTETKVINLRKIENLRGPLHNEPYVDS
jgi:hypothetical protein